MFILSPSKEAYCAFVQSPSCEDGPWAKGLSTEKWGSWGHFIWAWKLLGATVCEHSQWTGAKACTCEKPWSSTVIDQPRLEISIIVWAIYWP